MYLAGQRFEQGRRGRLRDAIRAAASEEEGACLVAGELDQFLGGVTEASDRDALYQKIARSVRTGEPTSASLTRDDVYGAIASFWLVFFSSIPAAFPFLFIEDSWIALRFSNAILIGLLFFVGYRWARHTNLPPIRLGLALLVGGFALVLIAIALGG
jgi:VIT1/CCC1 family predicted Fe2+/Mn2+ transporter